MISTLKIDVEAELNLPPGFRFHPTDEELVVDYLCHKAAAASAHPPADAAGVPPPPAIIAEVDLYKHNPWELPEMALFGTKEWYFYTPRDRKYPNGSRPNRAAGNGYWKATGADKPIRPRSNPKTTVGIKKALVFYAGKGPKGIKTNWIMHEYRLTTHNLRNATTCKLDDWVLCRLYNKKNNPNEKIIPEYHHHRFHHQLLSEESQRDSSNNSSLNSFEESDGDFGNFDDQGQVNNDQDIMFLGNFEPQTLTKVNATSNHNKSHTMEMKYFMQEDDEWLANLSLEDLQHSLKAMSDDYFQAIHTTFQ